MDCVIEGCNKPKVARGYCKVHYQRMMRYGRTHNLAEVPLSERYEAGTEKLDNGCIVWVAAAQDRYGKVSVNGRQRGTHVVAWEMANGPVPKGLLVRHSCHNRPCVNPEHLLLGTHADNSRDMVKAGRSACGEKARSAKLTAEQIPDIRASTKAYKDIGETYGITKESVWAIKHRKTWKHVL